MAATKVWTLHELHALPEDGNKYELVHGELFVTPAPGPRHENIAARLSAILGPYVMANGLGLVYHPRAVIQHEGSQVEPDLQVRQPLGPDEDWDNAPVPILAVEILSPSNRSPDQQRKRDFYLETGVRDYWVVDPVRRTVTSIARGRPRAETADALTWHPEGAVTPLVIDLRDVFGDMDRSRVARA
jgi:Uma2 family endonuclease